jgi:hypothetical protein
MTRYTCFFPLSYLPFAACILVVWWYVAADWHIDVDRHVHSAPGGCRAGLPHAKPLIFRQTGYKRPAILSRVPGRKSAFP